MGLRNGFLGFDNFSIAQWPLSPAISSVHATEGGSFLGTSRDISLFDSATRHARLLSIVQQLRFAHYDLLYVIGGDGSMKSSREKLRSQVRDFAQWLRQRGVI